jgi:hypothetical protein
VNKTKKSWQSEKSETFRNTDAGWPTRVVRTFVRSKRNVDYGPGPGSSFVRCDWACRKVETGKSRPFHAMKKSFGRPGSQNWIRPGRSDRKKFAGSGFSPSGLLVTHDKKSCHGVTVITLACKNTGFTFSMQAYT